MGLNIAYNRAVFRLGLTVMVLALGLAACEVNPVTPTPPGAVEPVAVIAAQVERPTRTPTVTPTVTATATETEPPPATVPWTPTVVPATVEPQPTAVKQAPASANAAATVPPTVTLAPIPPTFAPASGDVEQRMIDLINSNRAGVGLAPLVRDEGLMGIAQSRVDDMVARGYLGHDDPVTGTPLARELMRAAGYTSSYLGENWYASGKAMPGAVDHAMNWFMGDAPHRANILGSNFVYVGVGIAFNGQLWVMVQNFAGSNS
jgi:uncharacterized protein YkwD